MKSLVERNDSHDAVDFRAALTMRKYGLGTVTIARVLGRSRGLVQSWLNSGERHTLSHIQCPRYDLEARLRELKKAITFRYIDRIIAMEFYKIGLNSGEISEILRVPPTTVESWKNCPLDLPFADPKTVEAEYQRKLKQAQRHYTRKNIHYHLAIRLREEGEKKGKRIGSKTIYDVLCAHFYPDGNCPLSERTITSWLAGERHPPHTKEMLIDRKMVEQEFKAVVDDLTLRFIDHHVAMELFNTHGWSYQEISKTLGIDKEKVRGWTKKKRGNPLAMTFSNPAIITERTRDFLLPRWEEEVVYFLRTFPAGVSSPLVLRHLVDIPQEELEYIFENSRRIVRKNNRWCVIS